MKISSFYYNDMSQYENFLEKFSEDVYERFYGTGYNSLNIGRFINFLRTEITKYIDVNFHKKVHLIVLLPKNEQPFIEKTYNDKKEEVKVYLSYDIVKQILNGNYDDYEDYLSMIIEQINTVIDSQPSEFNDYLVIQMKNLSQLCSNELRQSFSETFIENHLKNPKSWVKLAKKSSIFNDYYNYYKQDKESHKDAFLKFLKMIILYVCKI